MDLVQLVQSRGEDMLGERKSLGLVGSKEGKKEGLVICLVRFSGRQREKKRTKVDSQP